MTEEDIKAMVNRFLSWPLPGDFHPDNGISFTRLSSQPVGTNLLTATQAEEMVRFMLEGEQIVVTAPKPSDVLKGRLPLAWGAKVSAIFRERVWWIGDEISRVQKSAFDANWLMACMAWESGESFSPAKKNMAGSGATGLIQFMPATAKELGAYRKTTLSTDALAAMTAEDQLTWVYWYFRMQIDRHGPITNLEDCYMAILWPGAIGKPVSAPLWDRGKMPTTYRQNAGLDSNRDGTITKLEAASHVRAKLDKGIKLAA